EWVNIHFPGANIDLVSFLIDGIHNGAYNTIEKTLTFTENEINENILKEEFGHIVFDHLTPEEKEKILNEVKELYPTIEDPIELEERLMEFVRKAEMAKPKSWIGKFYQRVLEFFRSLRNNRSEIQRFLDRFTTGYYSNVPAKVQNKNSVKSASPLTLHYQQKNQELLQVFLKTISREAINESLGTKSLIDTLITTKDLL